MNAMPESNREAGADLQGLRIGLLTASASRLGGGVFEAVAVHAAMIRGRGGEPVIFALEDVHSAEDAARFAPSQVIHAQVIGLRQIGFAPGLVRQLLEADLDVLHLHGIWMYPSAAGAAWARRTGRPYFVSPHGMLDPWITARGKLKKAVARLGYERRGWRRATALHALTPREAEDIARESGRRDSVVIPNAGPPAAPPAVQGRDARFLYIGRIHPKKNVVALVEAWRALDPQGAQLTIAGWGEPDHVAELEAALQGAPGSVRFVGPVYGETKQALLDAARFLVLPSHSEGLPVAVLESWAAGAPTIMTGECNLAEGFAAGAALECGYDSAAIKARLGDALALADDEWLAMSRAAHGLASGPFAAQTVADRWSETYRQAAAGKGGAR
jgi:poly(glycerol-phosphate) alpha-glucosyltransferase